MRKKYELTSLLFLLLLSPGAEARAEDLFIRPDGIGNVRLGAKVMELPRSAPPLYTDLLSHVDRNAAENDGKAFGLECRDDGRIRRITVSGTQYKTASGLDANASLADIARAPASQIVFQMDGLMYVEADGVRFHGFRIYNRAELETLKYQLSLDLAASEGRYSLPAFLRTPAAATMAENRALYIEIVEPESPDKWPAGYMTALRTIRQKTAKVRMTEVDCSITDRSFFRIGPFGLGPVLVGKKIREVDEFFRLHVFGLLFDDYALRRDRFLVFEPKTMEAEDILKRNITVTRTTHLLDKESQVVRTVSCQEEAFIFYDILDGGVLVPRYELGNQDKHLDELLQGKVMDICVDREGIISTLRIYDPRFRTESGLCANSSIWDIYQQEDAEFVLDGDGMHVEAEGLCFHGFFMDLEDMGIRETVREIREGKAQVQRIRVAELKDTLRKEMDGMSDEEKRLVLAGLAMNRADYIEIRNGYHACGFEAAVEMRRRRVEEQESWLMRYGCINLYVDATEWIHYRDIETETTETIQRIQVNYPLRGTRGEASTDKYMDLAVRSLIPPAEEAAVPADESAPVTFEDKAFKAFVVRDNSFLDLDGDQELSVGEALRVKNLNIRDGNHFLNMKATSDIRHFKNLEKVEILADTEVENGRTVYYSTADALDVSMLHKLEDLSCHLPLKTLVLGSIDVLSGLILCVCPDGMDELDLSGCPGLARIHIGLTGAGVIRKIRLSAQQKARFAAELKDKCEQFEVTQ